MSQSKVEILELIVGLKDLSIAVKKVMKDGKVDLDDLEALTDLVNQEAELTIAFEGLGNIKMDEIVFKEAIEILVALGKAAKEVSESGGGPVSPPDPTKPPNPPNPPDTPPGTPVVPNTIRARR